VIALDERLEQGGGHRVLGRLHARAPKIPLFTGWVDREKAVAQLSRAMDVGPASLHNALFLAQALLEHFPERKSEALVLLRGVVARPARPEAMLEDAQAIEEARNLLAELEGTVKSAPG
jgi:hypothetical protein